MTGNGLRPDLAGELSAEQVYVDRLYAHLDHLRARTETSLDQVRRAPAVPTPAGRAERDAFDALHTERLRQLRAVEDRLAFGRLDLVEGIRRYIGRLGLSDDERHQLLLDWRGPRGVRLLSGHGCRAGRRAAPASSRAARPHGHLAGRRGAGRRRPGRRDGLRPR